MTDASIKALSVLRHTDHMQWYVVPILVFVIYIYVVEIERKNWGAVLLGIAFWAAEFIWEMFNASILHFTQYAPLWCTPGPSAYTIYAGLNIEICLFFAICGVLIIKALPEDKNMKILAIPNRLFIPILMGLAGVFVEVLLNRCDLLIWDYKWWSWPRVYLIIIAYCAPFTGLAWLHDNLTMKAKVAAAIVVSLLAITCHVVFASMLGWV